MTTSFTAKGEMLEGLNQPKEDASILGQTDQAHNASLLIAYISYHLRTIWLFTRSDSLLVGLHWTMFGMFHALAGSLLTEMQHPPALLPILSRFPWAFLWMWLKTLIFNISNQLQPSSITEDSIDKPWRPLPSKRLTTAQARQLLFMMVPVVLILDVYLGAFELTLTWLVLNWMYNDLRGADEHFIARNGLNAVGLCCGSAGTMTIASGGFGFNTTGYIWLAVEGMIVFTTGHVQDLRDQAGDRASGRSTVPLIWGDNNARWSIAVPVLTWSIISPTIWGLGIGNYMAPMAIGITIALRVLCLRNVESDKLTYKLWSCWIGTLFLLPLCKNPSVFHTYV